MAAIPGQQLTAQLDLSLIFRSWLGGHPDLGHATRDWRTFLAGGTSAGGDDSTGESVTAPAWLNRDWRESWLAELLADLPDATARERARLNVEHLVHGEAAVVITGQQPGFLGGPLYSLYKAAAAVAAAQARTAAGYPTVPLFWLGDDDDDRQEAFQPRAHDPRRNVILQAVVPEGAADRMVGAVSANEWGRGEAAWLQEQVDRQELGLDLVGLWEAAIDSGLSWGRLQRRALLRLFRGTDLLCVSGNDSSLHGAAADFYERLWAARRQLPEEVQQRGQALVAGGFSAQIGETSLQNWLNLADGDRRLTWSGSGSGDEDSPDAAELPPAKRLRPGVTARSLVQDWLFAPAGVVVGPAELAYLKQLEPLYTMLELARSPLLPRLFARLVPAGQQAAPTGGPEVILEDITAATERITEAVRDVLVDALRREAKVSAEQARREATRLTVRWRQRVKQYLIRQRQAVPGPKNEVPLWVTAGGKRQERTLATHWAAALWGDDLVQQVIAAAAAHYAAGADGRWHEFHIEVADI